MSLPALYTNGKAFVEDGGDRRWVWKGASDFKLFARYFAGEDVLPVIAQRRALGANILRVFLMYDGALGRFHPWEHDWADRFRSFVELLAVSQMRAEFVVFADAQNAMPSHADQDHWFHDITVTLGDYTNATVELCNEWIQNGIDPSRFAKPNVSRLLCSRGSSGSDMPPWGSYQDQYFPCWDYDTWHGRRDVPKVTWSAEDAWYIGDGKLPDRPRHGSPHPIVHDEPIGFAEDAQPGRRANDTHAAQDIALGGRMLSGATFHSDQGINSELWTGKTLMCANAFYRVMNAFIGEDY